MLSNQSFCDLGRMQANFAKIVSSQITITATLQKLQIFYFFATDATKLEIYYFMKW